jgi:hypothetical protein
MYSNPQHDGSSLNVLTMVLYYYFLNFGLFPSSPYFETTTFRGMALPSFSSAPTLVDPVDGASLYRWMMVMSGLALRSLRLTAEE